MAGLNDKMSPQYQNSQDSLFPRVTIRTLTTKGRIIQCTNIQVCLKTKPLSCL